MWRFLKAACAGSVIFSLAGCDGFSGHTCAPGLGAPTAVFTLYLGRAIPGRGDLTDAEWQSFLDSSVTPNLPNGYTVLDAGGGWMNPITRKTIKEATKVLVVAMPAIPANAAAVNRVRADYQIKFHQQLVGLTVEQACAVF